MIDRLPHPEKSAEVKGVANVQPIPLRYWWLKRLTLAGTIFLVLLVGLRLYWGFEANRRLQAEVDRIHAEGLVVSVREVNDRMDAVRDEDNAAILLEEAIAGIVRTSSNGLAFDIVIGEPSAFFERSEDVGELMNANSGVLRLAHQARFKPHVAWSSRIPGTPPGRGQRALVKLLWFAATQQRLSGDYRNSIRTVQDGVAVGETIAAYPTVISNLVAWACDALIFTLIEDLGPAFPISDHESVTPSFERPAMRGDVVELMTSLLDEQAPRTALIKAYLCDQAQFSEFLNSLDRNGASATMGTSTIWDYPIAILGRPLFVLDQIRVIQYHEQAASALAEPTWPLAWKHFHGSSDEDSALHRLTHPTTVYAFGRLENSIQNCVRHSFQNLARRRMAATALAIALYRSDQGRLPDTLDDLVPAYLDKVPADPFSRSGSPIQLRQSEAGSILYSVGSDGCDDGGAARRTDHSGNRTGDLIFSLGGRAKWKGIGPVEPSSEANQDHDDK